MEWFGAGVGNGAWRQDRFAQWKWARDHVMDLTDFKPGLCTETRGFKIEISQHTYNRILCQERERIKKKKQQQYGGGPS